MMRNIGIVKLVLMLACLMSCSRSNDDNNTQKDPLIGRWQLVERFDGGSPKHIESVENGKIITFGADKTFSDDILEGCKMTYTVVSDSIIEVDQSCQSSSGKYKYYFKLEGSTLLFNSTPTTCIEGCYDKFRRR